ncbi:MAG: hypothetical protein MJZ61_08170, partial [Bacteroidales bacterium]|nr:hypothetical protein [Bacteroidales bacterium]
MGQNSTADIASSDIIHTRIALKVDPGKRFLAGSTTHIVAIADSCKWLPIELQLSDDYIINSITSGPHQLPYYRQSGKLRIYPHPLWGKTDSVTINYCGIPPSTGLGSVVFDRHDTVPVFWTMSEPYGAMDWFPCKQDINDKIDSTFIIITCPKRYTAVSNGVLHSDTETESGNMRRMEWRHHYPIAYYLIAVAVSNYRKYSDWGKGAGNDSVEIVNYVYPEKYEQWRRKTYKLIPAMRMLCDSFGPYPFRNEKYA